MPANTEASAAIYLVFTDVEPGREDEFGNWYDTVHIPDLLTLGSIASAERFRLKGSGQEMRMKDGSLHVPRFLTIYHLTTSDPDALKAELQMAAAGWRARGRAFDGHRTSLTALYEVL